MDGIPRANGGETRYGSKMFKTDPGSRKRAKHTSERSAAAKQEEEQGAPCPRQKNTIRSSTKERIKKAL
jgi:hypothetical protein